MCLQDRSQLSAAACINVEEGGKGDLGTVCLHTGGLPPVKRQVVGFCSSYWETWGKSRERETGAFLLTTAELTITLQLCCHRLPGFLSSALVMLRGLSPRSYSPEFGGFLGLGNQACLMEQFVQGAVEKRSWGDVRAACAEGQRGVSKDRMQPVPAVPRLAGLPQQTAERAPPFTTESCSESSHSSALGRSLGWAYIFPSADTLIP